jgi:phospholipase A1
MVTFFFCVLMWGASAAGQTATADGQAANTDLPIDLLDQRTGLTFHRPMYVLPATWSEELHGKETEMIFQLSAKVRLFRSQLYLGYTQQSYWQAYNNDVSSPFRETNHHPELFYRILPGNLWLKEWGLDLGIEHASNGRSAPESRSWNRLYAAPFLQTRSGLSYIKLWYRIPESDKTTPLDSDGDDNPDITDYYGYGELHYRLLLKREHVVHAMLRGNMSTGKGALQLDYTYPTGSRNLYALVYIWTGYGESLIDYNRSVTRVGIGVAFNR